MDYKKENLLTCKLGSWELSTNITGFLKDKYVNRINNIKSTIKNNVMVSEMSLSKSSILLMFDIEPFIEINLIKKLPKPPKDSNIMLIKCNGYSIEHINYKKPIPKVKSNRGRKRTKTTKPKEGVEFNSQITFVIKNTNTTTDYQIKLFRNGRVHIPGVKELDRSDIIKPLEELHTYLCNFYKKDIKVYEMHESIRNYKFNILDSDLKIDLYELQNIIENEKNNIDNRNYFNYLMGSLNTYVSNNIKDKIYNFNYMNIAETLYNPDGGGDLTIKFYRPNNYNKKDKKITMKITKNSKFNIKGSNSHYESLDLYYWILSIIDKYKNSFLIDIKNIVNECDTSDCSDVSIYDD